MNWNAIGAIGQILGSFATLVTVGYLVVQVHDTETEMRRAVAQSLSDQTSGYVTSLAADERRVGIHTKVNAAVFKAFPVPPISKAADQQGSSFFRAAIDQGGLSLEEAYTL